MYNIILSLFQQLNCNDCFQDVYLCIYIGMSWNLLSEKYVLISGRRTVNKQKQSPPIGMDISNADFKSTGICHLRCNADFIMRL